MYYIVDRVIATLKSDKALKRYLKNNPAYSLKMSCLDNSNGGRPTIIRGEEVETLKKKLKRKVTREYTHYQVE